MRPEQPEHGHRQRPEDDIVDEVVGGGGNGVSEDGDNRRGILNRLPQSVDKCASEHRPKEEVPHIPMEEELRTTQVQLRQ